MENDFDSLCEGLRESKAVRRVRQSAALVSVGCTVDDTDTGIYYQTVRVAVWTGTRWTLDGGARPSLAVKASGLETATLTHIVRHLAARDRNTGKAFWETLRERGLL